MDRPDVRQTTWVGLAATAGVVATVAILLGPAPGRAQNLVGRCYEVHHETWAPAVALDADSILLGLPSRVRFTEEPPLRGLEGDRVLAVAPGAVPSVHSVRAWRVVGDSVRTVWTNGFSGVRGAFGLSGDTLAGEVQSFWDFERTRQSASARLEPVACEAPHDLGLVTSPSLPRTVALADGRRIELGASLSTVPGVEEGRGRLSRYIRGAEVFGARADEIRITPNSTGTIRLVVIRFSDAVDEDALFTTLGERFGPAPLGERSGGETADSSVLWGDRWTRITYRSSVTTDGRRSVWLMLSDPSIAR